MCASFYTTLLYSFWSSSGFLFLLWGRWSAFVLSYQAIAYNFSCLKKLHVIKILSISILEILCLSKNWYFKKLDDTIQGNLRYN